MENYLAGIQLLFGAIAPLVAVLAAVFGTGWLVSRVLDEKVNSINEKVNSIKEAVDRGTAEHYQWRERHLALEIKFDQQTARTNDRLDRLMQMLLEDRRKGD